MSDLELNEKIEGLISNLKLDEKIALVQGTEFWKTNAVERLGIPSIFMSDGPHGLRKQAGDGDHLGLNVSEKATCFPPASTVASSFNVENARLMGEAIARECNHYGVNVLLGPGINIKRNPLCGRNFEYYSEDPIVSGEMGKSFVEGVQGMGVGACVKHFACNNLEAHRFGGNSVVDERALREVYLKPFEIALQANPATVMCAYNCLNDSLCSENHNLLTERLRNEMGFKGAVVSDWGAVANRVAALSAGLDLEMPGDIKEYSASIKEKIVMSELGQEVLDEAVRRVLRLVLSAERREEPQLPAEENAAIAVQIAKDSAVLMKNDGALPILPTERILVVGELFAKMRYQGAGSSMINPVSLISPESAFKSAEMAYEYCAGYSADTDKPNSELVESALNAVGSADKVLFFCGLTEDFESEGYDRNTLLLPQNQIELLDAIVKKGRPVVLVLFGGSPFVIPHFYDVNAVLNMYLPGQGGGEAVRSLLVGECNPSGKLAETWVQKYEDVPFYNEFASSRVEAYRESVFVGYRYYDHAEIEPLCEFGFGLSYTQFEYSGFSLARREDEIIVSCKVKNVGEVKGAEVVQLYLGRNKDSGTFKPIKTLRAFSKVYLEAGESQKVTFTFNERDFAFYDIFAARERLEAGIYPVYIGASSRDIRWQGGLELEGELPAITPIAVLEAYQDGKNMKVSDGVFQLLSARGLSDTRGNKLTIDSRLMEIKRTFFGKMLYKSAIGQFKNKLKEIQSLPEEQRICEERGIMFIIKMMDFTTPRMMFAASGGKITLEQVNLMVEFANGKLGAGIKLMKAFKKAKDIKV